MTSAAPTPAGDNRKWLVLIAIGMGIFLATIDGTIVTVALPTLIEQLETDFPTIQWVTLSYLLTVTVLLLGMGRLGDMIGKKRPYMAGMALFGVASALCGLANGAPMLIAFRVLQAIGAAMMQALGTAIVTEAFPSSQRGQALGISGLLVSAGFLTGPVLGGLLIDSVGWRSIFFVNVPVAIIGLVMVNRFVPRGERRPGQRFDVIGAALLTICLIALMTVLTFGQNWGWGDGRTVGLFIMSVIFLAAFIMAELHVAQPMVDLTLFRNSQFTVSLILAVLVFIATSSRIIIPFYLEDALEVSALGTGLILAVWPLALALVAPAAGWLSDRIGSMRISTLGLVVSAAGYWLLGAFTDLTTAPAIFALLSIPTGLGIGLFQSPNNSAVMGSVPHERLGLASGFLALTRNLGQLIGIALVGALWATRSLSYVIPEMAGEITTDAGAAPPDAIAAGTAETFLILAGMLTLTIALGLAAVRLESRRRAALAIERQAAGA